MRFQWNWLTELFRSLGFVSLIIGMGFLSSHPICDGNDHIICEARGRCGGNDIFVVEPEAVAMKNAEDLKNAIELVHEKGDIGMCLSPKVRTQFLKRTKTNNKKFLTWIFSLYQRADHDGGTASLRHDDGSYTRH